MAAGESILTEYGEAGQVKLEAGAVKARDVGVPLSVGYVGEHKVEVVRDTGCNTVIISRKFVVKSEFTGQVRPLKLLENTERCLPAARIKIDTP